MGKALSTAGKRTVRNWNVENRAHRTLDKTEKKREQRRQVLNSAASAGIPKKEENAVEPANVEDFEEQKSIKLNEWLKTVRVDSQGPPREIKSRRSNYPESRAIVEDPEFGYTEPDHIPKGRLAIRQALDFIGKHQENPEVYTKNMISMEYNIDEAHIHQILKYYKMYNLKLPQESKAQKLLQSSPSTSRSESIHKLLKSLGPSQQDEDPDASSNKKR